MSNWRFSDELGVERELSTGELRTALSSGTLLPSTLVWREGMKEWQPAFTLPELATAAIAAARGPRSPSVPPPAPPKKRGPQKTLLGVASPLAALDPRIAPPKPTSAGEAAQQGAIVVPAPTGPARTSPETQPMPGMSTEDLGIPRAPRVPRDAPEEGTDGAAAAPDANATGRPRSVPPPLPGSIRQTNKLPRRLPTPAPFQQQPASQRRPTLMGIPRPPPTSEENTLTVTQSEIIEASRGTAPTRSKPPPPLPPKRSVPPAAPDASATIAQAAAEPTGSKPKVKPPVPTRRSIPPGGATPSPPAAATPTPAAAEPRGRVAPPRRIKTLEMEAILEPSPPPGSASPAPGAEPAAQAAATPAPAAAEPPRKETTEQIQRKELLGAKDLLASLADEDDASTLVRKSFNDEPASTEQGTGSGSGEPSSRRAKTLEMSLADHAEAAESNPVPPEGDDAPAADLPPRSLTDRIPPPARVPETERTSDAPGVKSISGHPGTMRGRAVQAVQIPRRSIVGVSVLWMLGLVSFFFVGRCSGIRKASELEDAREGLTKAFLLRALPRTALGAGAAVSSEPKPCWVSRQPSRWAKEASKSIPFDSEPSGTTMALGYAVSDKEAVGIVIDPKTGKFEEKFRKKADDPLGRVAPMSTAEGGYFLGPKGDKDILPIEASTPFYLVFDKGSVGHASAPDAAPAEIFHVDGDGDISAPQALSLKTAAQPEERFFVSFRRGTHLQAGYFGGTFAPLTPLAEIPGSGGKIGKPKSGFNGSDVAIVFADMPEGEKEWQVRLGHAPAGSVPDATTIVDLPEGGPGGDKISPDIVGLDDGRWILMWTEGGSGARAIRAITLTHDFQPIGDPIALSPPAGDFGQASLAVLGSYTTVVFLQRGEDGFEMWGAVLQCG